MLHHKHAMQIMHSSCGACTLYLSHVFRQNNKVIKCMQEQYADETFVHVLPAGQIPHTRHVRGSNFTYISVFPDRLPGRAIIIAGMRLVRSKRNASCS